MFLDEATIDVRGGKGGDGCKSFRREKFVPEGGPNGGDGGRGGSVYLVADDNTDTLSVFASRKKFEAQKGQNGMGALCGGHDGEDLLLPVPPGTEVVEILTDYAGEETTKKLGDLVRTGDKMLIARGGRGGFGNAHFKTSTRQAPDFAELGEPGHLRRLKLDLKLVADAGIIGYPSVGKSTLISVISAAKPKIAAYAFTTLVPNLGVVNVADRSYVVCDVPGLIEGASEGKGLGDKFLRHIERCGVLLHLLDISRAFGEDGTVDPKMLVADYKAIRKELKAYSPTLEAKRELVILNKTDLINHESESVEKALKKAKIPVFMSISTATRHGIDDLVKKLLKIVLEERGKRTVAAAENEEKAKATPETPVLRPHLAADQMGAFKVETRPDGSIHVHGARLEQFTQMTNFMNEQAVQRFKNVIDRVGLIKTLKKHRKSDTMPVYIGGVRVDEHLG
jgi:GTP-binding protein